MNYKNINDYELMYMIRENDDNAINMMYEKYLPLIRKIASKYYSKISYCGVDFDDFVQEGMIAVNRAIISYDSNSDVMVYTYIALCIERHYMTYCRNISNSKHYYLNTSVNDDDYAAIDYRDCEYYMNNIIVSDVFTEYKNKLEFLDANIFELRFNGFSYKEIAILLDLSYEFILRRISIIRKMLGKKKKRLI